MNQKKKPYKKDQYKAFNSQNSLNKEWDYKIKTKPKFSVGIALCRYNYKKKNIEILFVKKRCTYWYITFVLGKYELNDDKQILFMLSRMTPEEKLVILTMNYRSIWDHNWQTHNYNPKFNRKTLVNQEFYDSKKNKFEALIRDNGQRLRVLISRSQNRQLIWEIPKGRKHNNSENDVECAVREFKEETNIEKDSYTFLPINPITFSHRDGDTYYTNSYYIAMPTRPIKCKLNFDMLDQISEIIDVKWFTEQEANLMNCGHPKFLHKLFLMCKKIRPINLSIDSIVSDVTDESSFYDDIPFSISSATKNE